MLSCWNGLRNITRTLWVILLKLVLPLKLFTNGFLWKALLLFLLVLTYLLILLVLDQITLELSSCKLSSLFLIIFYIYVCIYNKKKEIQVLLEIFLLISCLVIWFLIIFWEAILRGWKLKTMNALVYCILLFFFSPYKIITFIFSLGFMGIWILWGNNMVDLTNKCKWFY